MATRNRIVGESARIALALAILGWAGCGGAEDGREPDSRESVDAEVPRTADPAARGLTEADFPRVQEIADGVFTYEALRSAGEERFTTVSLFVVSADGVLVADGQGNEEETGRLVAAIGEVTDAPITHVVISSDHGDHTGGNAAFPAEAEYIAHPTSAELMRASASRRAGRGGAPGGGEEAAEDPRLPTRLVSARETLVLGGREIELVFLGRAHTGGDLLVHLPAERVLFMSEAYLNRVFPAMRSAYPSEWLAVLDRALAMDIEWYVPGHGFVESASVLAEELATYRDAMNGVIAEARRLHADGVPADEAVDQAQFGDLESWSLRTSQGATAIRRVYAELNGELPNG